MRIGVPKEIKVHEYRVGLTPASVRELASHGHEVLVAGRRRRRHRLRRRRLRGRRRAHRRRRRRGLRRGRAGREGEGAAARRMRAAAAGPGAVHLPAPRAPTAPQAEALMRVRRAPPSPTRPCTEPDGGLPLLAPMSEVAGRMAVQVGAHCLEKASGGAGMLLGGVPGVPPARVVVLGGGVVGHERRARSPRGMRAEVTVLDRYPRALRALDVRVRRRGRTPSSPRAPRSSATVLDADLVIGAVLVPGAAAPQAGHAGDGGARCARARVMVDVAIDQGGCFETIAPDHPCRARPMSCDGVVHYCVTNMPGAVARTSTFALNNATLPYVLRSRTRAGARLRREPARGRAERPRRAACIRRWPRRWRARRRLTPSPGGCRRLADAHRPRRMLSAGTCTRPRDRSSRARSRGDSRGCAFPSTCARRRRSPRAGLEDPPLRAGDARARLRHRVDHRLQRWRQQLHQRLVAQHQHAVLRRLAERRKNSAAWLAARRGSGVVRARDRRLERREVRPRRRCAAASAIGGSRIVRPSQTSRTVTSCSAMRG